MGTTAPPAIETRQLTKYYGKARGIIDLDLRVEAGEVFGFLGPNGAGKTTTIRLLMDLIHPTSGHAAIFGKDVREESVAIKAITGYLPGELALWNNLTGRQILTFLGNLRGGVSQTVPSTEHRVPSGPGKLGTRHSALGTRIEELAGRLQLDLDRKFREYSKGNKQKVGLVQAFMHRPRLLILDEPTSGLDPLNQQEFFHILSEAHAEGATVFLSSHVLSEAEHTCDRVGIIREGRLVRTGSVREIVAEKLYHITLSLGVPAGEDLVRAFASLPSVSQVRAGDHTVEFVVRGDVDPVVKRAANYPVLSITSHEPTLEEAFLTYYRGPGQGSGIRDQGSGSA